MTPPADDQLLQDMGLSNLSGDELQAAQDRISAALEERVGDRLVNQLSGEQMVQFEKFIQSNDPDGAVAWVRQQVPGSDQIIKEELEKLKQQVKEQGLGSLPEPEEDVAPGEPAAPPQPDQPPQA